MIEIESYVKSAEEVLTDALMRDLEENSDLDEVFDVDEEGEVEVEVDNQKECVQFEIKIYVKSIFGSLVANFNHLFISLEIF